MSQLPRTDQLSKDPVSPGETQLLSHINGLLSMSRDAMSSYYSQWDAADATFRGESSLDKDDAKADRRGEPTKMVVPLTYAQIMSFISFNYLLMTQNRTFYELQGTGDEDAITRPDCELILARDVARNQWASRVVQFLLDEGKYGLGILDCSWEECWYRHMVTETQEEGDFFGVPIAGETVEVEQAILRYEGNKVTNISPYRWFPDTRLPISRFQEGEFVATEDEISKTALRRLEVEGLVNGIDQIPEMSAEKWKSRSNSRLPYFSKLFRDQGTKGETGSGLTTSSSAPQGMIVLTRVQIDIVPKDYTFNGKPLGSSKWPTRYLVWIANDQKIIRCEPMNVLHGMFTQAIGEFAPDQHHLINQGLAEIVDKLQRTVSWYISSHVAAVRNVINNKVVVDPAGVDMKSLEDPQNPFILLKKNASRQGNEKWITQLRVADTTGGHMADADMLSKLMQVVTGINDNAQGQYNSGRRSATEARAVTAGAAGRLKTHAALNWTTAFQPLGQMMLTNARQMLSLDSFLRIVGKPTDPVKIQLISDRYIAFKSTLEDLVGGEDFFIFDSTLSSEKGFVAQSLQELFIAILSNPQLALNLNIDPRAMLKEIMFLRGVTNFSRFDLPSNIMTGQTPPPPIQPALPAQNVPTV